MDRIKGILAAGALTGLVIATSIGLGARSTQAQQTAVERPIIIERVTASQSQPTSEAAGGEYYEEEEWEGEEWDDDDDDEGWFDND